MKILELTITNFRGIRDLTLKPDGKNLVIWGPNGSGKSGVVDAVDFLLTGDIARLRGAGTAGVSLGRHGPHIAASAASAVVSAIVRLPMVDEGVEISRSMANPAVLEVDEMYRANIDSALESASLGQHVLTRRNLLQFITANASTRAQQIQLLLGLTDVEEIRTSIVAAVGQINRSVAAAESALARSQQAIATITDLESIDEETLLQFVNSRRGVLGDVALDVLDPSTLKHELDAPSDATRSAGDPELVVRAISSLETAIESPEVASDDGRLREILERFGEDAALQTEASRHRLSSLGLGLLGEDGACPLCDTEWPPGVLRDRLRERLESAKEGAELNRDLEKRIGALRVWASRMSSDVTTLHEQLTLFGRMIDDVDLTAWKERLEVYVESLSSVESYLTTEPDGGLVSTGFAPEAVHALAEVKNEMALASLQKDPRQDAWDTLTRLEGAIKNWQTASRTLEAERIAQTHVARLRSAFELARDSVLGALYDEVRDRFVALYRTLHRHESGFHATLEPSGAGIGLGVDFHRHGTHPPNALHSEGHQDSMGICLYLALSEHLADSSMGLSMLDDVMMSIDSSHRRPLAKLLATEFPERQLIITTHDRTWSHQLRTEGVVVSRNQIHFSDWDIHLGPQSPTTDNLWDLIDSSMGSGDIPAAAHRLRRGSEEFFSGICDGLEADVRFRLDSRTELGDLVPAAIRTLKKSIKRGKSVADGQGNTVVRDRLAILDASVSTAVERAMIEQWVVNDNVHYNHWADFSKEDFEPVIDAFRDLFAVFQCMECHTSLRTSHAAGGLDTVTCACGATAWTLKAP